VLNFFAAQTRARELTHKDADDIATGAPATLDDALKRYKASLEARGSGLANETSLRSHLTPTLLAKLLAMLTGDELTAWRDGLVAKGLKASTANRYMGPLRAALNAAAKRDPRIKKNESAWSDHLENLSDANNARRAYLDEMKIRELVAESYRPQRARRRILRSFGVERSTRKSGRPHSRPRPPGRQASPDADLG
jgi:hypothetical protein